MFSTSLYFIDCGLLLEVFITGTSGLSWGKSYSSSRRKLSGSGGKKQKHEGD